MGFFVLFYSLISIPAFTNIIKDRAAQELSNFLGGKVTIGDIDVYPFNELQISNLEVFDLQGSRCLQVETIGAGIRLWKLLLEGEIELTYGEIIGLHANIIQEKEDAPLNIDYIVKAFSSKNDSTEKKPFSLSLHNVVLRKSSATFSRPWMEHEGPGNLDLTNIQITDLAADISFPKISNEGVEVDLRRLSLKIPEIIYIEKIRLKGFFNSHEINVKDFTLEFPSSRLYIPSIYLSQGEYGSFQEALKNQNHSIEISHSYVTPKDFAFLWSPLENLNEPLPLSLLAKGNLENLEVENFKFGNPTVLNLTFSGEAQDLSDLDYLKVALSDFNLYVSSDIFQLVQQNLKNIPAIASNVLKTVGDLKVSGDFEGSLNLSSIKGNLDFQSEAFTINLVGEFQKTLSHLFEGEGEINISDLRLQEFFPTIPVDHINATIIAEGSLSKIQQNGILSLVVDDFEMKGKHYNGLSLNISKNEEIIEGDLLINNGIADLTAKFQGDLDKTSKAADIDIDIIKLDLSEIADMKAYKDYIIKGNIKGNARGTDLDDMRGDLTLHKLSFSSPDNSRNLNLNMLKIKAENIDSIHTFNIKSDWFDARLEGQIKPKDLKPFVLSLAESICPVLFRNPSEREMAYETDIDFDIEIKSNNTVTEFFNLPFRFLVPLSITGSMNGEKNNASLIVDIPYLQQGKDKLVYDSRLNFNIDGNTGELDGLIKTTLPVKKGDLALNIELFGHDNSLSTDIRWKNTENADFNGNLSLNTEITKNLLSSQPIINLSIKPSVFQMGSSGWNVDHSLISYSDKRITVEGLKIWNNDQYVSVSGSASPQYEDVMRISLADIDVNYVFDMLQINYVTFGGIATGEISGHSLLSGDPVAETESFKINEFSYNGAKLGDCIVTSKWNNDEKEIEITADISHQGKRCVYASGGIWLGKDSLCFNMSADKVPVDFVQPFMAVFSSHVGGYATGDVKLFGTFHDIDMTGKVFADSVAIKLDYTNTIYHGSDTVFLNPGQINIPHFRLYDKFGNSALMTGELTHHYFHDPSFTFRLSDAHNFLCYDTNAEINPDWYGTLFGNGSAYLTGIPGLVDISADMTITDNSAFTFVLNDTQYAQDYQFLTFSDKRGEEKRMQSIPTVDDFKERLRKKLAQDEGSLSRFGLDIRASVTPQALFTLVMDPRAGDKITARGRGAMQVKYESDNDEMMMYGKYEIDEGNYNFSLQDIILRDFKIKDGSYIAFNGNPLTADLDISATYRVNTNLSDLDKSFSTDRDLNRTNVPVDAVLSVTGNMQQPDITFDIELPTLTQDVERKVKSIISTDDMMNRQIIYLLALNRFYTPEYMGTSGNGGELAAVASSTISSQLTNILGQLTDKFSVAPSIRSDKGDFSDIEVDVALSSRLLNNRLLINGNFGYRDRSNSSTTFVGDFDVEYLLSKNGNLRLKAYNHFNDQNYYLREALTTQGLGVVYRRDFDDWFTFLKKKKTKEEPENNNTEEDTENTITVNNGTEDR